MGERLKRKIHTKYKAGQPVVKEYDYLLIFIVFKYSFYAFLYACGKILERCY